MSNNKFRVKLFTHIDLDGVGCAIVAKHAFNGYLDIEFCGYNNIDQKVMEFIQSGAHLGFDAIFITDISVNEDTAHKLDGCRIQLIDHHATAEWMQKKYDWAWIEVKRFRQSENREVPTCGTTLFYEYLVKNNLLPRTKLMDNFTETVRRYDTWDWHNYYKDDHPKQMNELLYLIGRFKFMDRFTNNLSIEFTPTEQSLLDVEKERTNYYLESKEKEMKIRTVQVGNRSYTTGVVFCDQKQSELGNFLSEKHPYVDFIMLVNMGKKQVSLRGSKDHIHLGDIAKKLGNGGGHPKAAGFQLKEMILNHTLNNISKLGG